MDGLYKVWARRSSKIRPAKVKIRIGKPFYVRDVIGDRAVNSEQIYERVTDHLKSTIAGMIDDLRSGTKKELTD
jgi:hypothetical protein